MFKKKAVELASHGLHDTFRKKLEKVLLEAGIVGDNVVSVTNAGFEHMRAGSPMIINPVAITNPVVGQVPSRTAPTSTNTNHAPTPPQVPHLRPLEPSEILTCPTCQREIGQGPHHQQNCMLKFVLAKPTNADLIDLARRLRSGLQSRVHNPKKYTEQQYVALRWDRVVADADTAAVRGAMRKKRSA
jgi:hypothetical protein